MTTAALAVALGTPTTLATAAGEPPADAPYAVEDGAYPNRENVLGLTGADLIAGDGNITLTSCAGPYQIKVWAVKLKSGDSRICFAAADTGYLSVSIPRAYRIETTGRDIKAGISIAGTTESLTIPHDTSAGFGEANISDPKQAVLLEMRVSGTTTSAAPPPTGDNPQAFTGKLNIGDTRSCTATLVDPRWVIAAKSCFADKPAQSNAVAAGAPKQKTIVTVGRSDLATSGGHTTGIVELIPHPERDLVMARLDQPANNVTPVALSATAPAAGEELTVAGFGRTQTDWAPTKVHTSTFTVATINATGFGMTAKTPADATICKGDAGAPALRTEKGKVVLAALVSRSWQNNCLDSSEEKAGAYTTRVDDLGQWIQLRTGPRWGGENEAGASKAQELWGDFNGDGKTDAGVFYNYGQSGGVNRSGLWTQAGNGAGFDNPLKVWDSVASGTGSFNWDRSKALTGDFNGDGKTDVGVLYNDGQDGGGVSHTSMWTFISNGIGFDKPTKVWESNTSFNWDRAKPVTGDFNGDRKSDVGFLYNNGQQGNGSYQTTVWTITSTGSGFSALVNKWDNVAAGAGSWTWERSKVTAGDFNGDGKTDIGVLYDLGQGGGNNLTALWTFANTGGGFGNPVKVWDNDDRTTGSWNWNNSKLTAGDYNGDGKTDVGILYNNGQTQDGRNQTTLWTLNSTGTGFNGPAKKWDSGTDSWNWNTSKPGTGDFDGDGKTDIGVYYDHGQQSNGTSRTGLWKFTGSGTGFNAPALGWDSNSLIR
ncbi:trypsin-like serine protease [Streptomyces sp. NPDC055005]